MLSYNKRYPVFHHYIEWYHITIVHIQNQITSKLTFYTFNTQQISNIIHMNLEPNNNKEYVNASSAISQSESSIIVQYTVILNSKCILGNRII